VGKDPELSEKLSKNRDLNMLDNLSLSTGKETNENFLDKSLNQMNMTRKSPLKLSAYAASSGGGYDSTKNINMMNRYDCSSAKNIDFFDRTS